MTSWNQAFLAGGLLAAAVALSGCDTVGSIGEVLGTSQPAPGEFDMVKRPPLTIPPDFSLRPPQGGGGGDSEGGAAYFARQTVFGLETKTSESAAILGSEGRSAGEAALLKHAGAVAKEPNVRMLVDQETEDLAERERAFVDQLMNPDEAGSEGQDQAVADQDDGESPWPFDSERKPVIERKSDGVLDSLF